MSVSENIYYRRLHVTGPGCVLVSLKFGIPKEGVVVVKRLDQTQENSHIQFDLDRHIKEIMDGVQEANIKYGGKLQVEEIEVIPNDYPTRGQAKYAAFQIAEYILLKN